MLQNCKIIDTTLREGEQTPGIIFSLQDKLRIIEGLAEIGVQEIELGIASRLTTCLPELVRQCRQRWPEIQTAVWCRCKEDDIRFAASLTPQVISLSIPVSELHLKDKLGKNREWAARTLRASIESALNFGLKVAVGFEDALRAEPAFLLQMARLAEQSGAFRIRVADTVGTASPGTIRELMLMLGRALSTAELAIHTHNDFGMATANAIAALENGAVWADATVLGLGERCGCARLEELAAYLHLIGNNSSFRVENLRSLATYVAKCAAVRIPDNLPVLGKKIFTCETGLHLQGLQNAPQTYEPYAPEKVNATRHLVLGAKAGTRALCNHFRKLGRPISRDRVTKNLQAVRDTSSLLKRPLTDMELENLLTRP